MQQGLLQGSLLRHNHCILSSKPSISIHKFTTNNPAINSLYLEWSNNNTTVYAYFWSFLQLQAFGVKDTEASVALELTAAAGLTKQQTKIN